MPTVSTKNLGIEHTEWVEKLRSLKDSLLNYKNQLTEIAGKQHSKELAQSIEHFQNQFILQREQLDIIRHDLKQHENLIEDVEKGKGKEPSPGLDNVHKVQREKLEQFEKIFHDLRKEFNVFLDKVDY